jgi:hypothetical protein
LAAFSVASFVQQAQAAAPAATDVRVTNTVANPVPVVAVPQTAAPQVTCRFILTSVTQPFARGFMEDQARSLSLSSFLLCPPGVNALDVTRVSYNPFAGLASRNVSQALIAVGLSSKAVGGEVVPFAVLSMSNPEAVPTEPVRIDKQTTEGLTSQLSCSSGVASAPPTCGGVLYLTGTPR